MSFSRDLVKKLQSTLLRVGTFHSYVTLRSLFIDERIHQWIDLIPQVTTTRERIQVVISEFGNLSNANYENALVLFLRVLADLIPVEDANHQEILQLADQVDQSLSIVPVSTSESVDWKTALSCYRSAIVERYSTMHILGHPDPISIEGIFTHIRLLDKPSAWRFYDFGKINTINPFEVQEKLYASVNRIDGLELVKRLDNRHIFIFGKPGAGKTTFLRYLALQAAQEQINRVPIFISIRQWADSNLPLSPFIVKQFEDHRFPDVQTFVRYTLNEGQALLLFDGLDELRQEDRDRMQLIPELRTFAARYFKNQIVITCRTAALTEEFDSFKYVEVADFDERQMRVFTSKWFKNDYYDGQFWHEFSKPEHSRLRDLGRVPLFLTLLCLAFTETMTFPRRQADLYELALDALLTKWDASRGILRDQPYQYLSLNRKRQMLSEIAAKTFDLGSYFFRQDSLERYIAEYLSNLPPGDRSDNVDTGVILRSIEAQHGILVQRATNIYSFAHLTFQEYYAAKHIVDHMNERTLTELFAHVVDDRWWEVIRITASLLADADLYFTHFHRSLRSFLQQDSHIVAFVQGAGYKASLQNVNYGKIAAVRSFYCLLELVLEIDTTNGFSDDTPRHHTRSIDDYPESAITFAKALGLNLKFGLSPCLSVASDLFFHLGGFEVFLNGSDVFKLDFMLVRALVRFRWFSRHRTIGLTNVFDADLEEVKSLATKCNAVEILSVIQHLDVPNDADWEEWEQFCTAFQENIRKYRGMAYRWSFSEEQIAHLTRYLTASHFLLECLDLAYVVNRGAIENSLLVA